MSAFLVLTVGLGWLATATPSSATSTRPCAPTSPEWTQAQEALAALDGRVEALAVDADTRETRAALVAVLAQHCFALAKEESRWPEDTVPALAWKTWWRDGGKAWLASYLELGKPGPHEVVLPPDVRDVLTLESAPEHRLAELLCPLRDEACGAETGAWRARAEKSFLPENRRTRHHSPSSEEAPSVADCEKHVKKRPAWARYPEWRACVACCGRPPVRSALPLGRFRAPKDGWLVIRGRRGHYGFCDEVRAYHLGTGTAYVSQSCSDLALTEKGEVDAKGTDAARKDGVKAGSMATERLRALTWMLLVGPEVKSEVQVEAWRVPVPAGLRVERTKRSEEEGVMGGVAGGIFGFHTGQTRLKWTWFPAGDAEPLSGVLTYPDSYDVAQDHADVLLEEAEATFQEGCPAAPTPLSALDFTRAPGVSSIDAPQGTAPVQDARVEALRAWRPPAGCAPGRDGG